ncbi:hypothetical protein PBF_17879 [Cytobacillus firmus DS1]|uniref:DUF4870 domain-containing protein n=2 Tax=Cytobacillus firmus TaxID=1399 RepID=W7L3N5_CYTFI|nr:hypothetical protein PBF_17879 [Cytobacillus firmus DS1]
MKPFTVNIVNNIKETSFIFEVDLGGNRMNDYKMPSNDERLIAAAIYVTSFFTAFVGPLIIWLLKKNDSEFVDYHGKEYLNFLISYSIYSAISVVLMIILIGVLTIWIVGILAFIFTIVAAVKAYEGKEYRIPLVFRILK